MSKTGLFKRQHCSITMSETSKGSPTILTKMRAHRQPLALFVGVFLGFVAGVFVVRASLPLNDTVDLKFTSVRHSELHPAPEAESKRLGVCITGQLGRLELESKIKNIFEVNTRSGWTVDVLVLLAAEQEAKFVNRRVPIISQTDYPTDESVEDALRPYVSRVKVARVAQPSEPLMRDAYVAGLDKSNMEEERRLARARGHVRQWYMLRECSMQLLDMEVQNGAPYTDFVRLREDSLVFAPLRPIPDIPGLEDRSLITPLCDAWSGINDKAAVLRKHAAHGYFEAPLDFFYLFGDEVVDNWSALLRPEIVIREALRWKSVPVEKVAPLDLPVITQRLTETGSCVDTVVKGCYGRWMNETDIMQQFRSNWCT